MTDAPLILTTREQSQCHERWLRWKKDFADRVNLVKRLFDMSEASIRSFGPHVHDVWWINLDKLHEDVYGRYDPLDNLLEALHFPAQSDMVDRGRYMDSLRKLILEHEDYGNGGNYMPRSVILGWVIRQHDTILSDLNEAA